MHALQPGMVSGNAPELALNGVCGYQVDNGRVVINVDSIANNRPYDNISGTLSVELWALGSDYRGGDFSGFALAGTQIGEIAGQHHLPDCRYDLIFQEPPAGRWNLALMLREWTDSGYMTRDHVSFAVPYVSAPQTAVVQRESDNVISVSFKGKAQRVAAPVEVQEEPKTAAVKETKPAARAETRKPAPQKAAARGKTETPTADGRVSLNEGSYKDIVSVKGISKKLAENIVAARPFGTLDEVRKVKGMGERLLAKLAKLIKL